MPYLTPTSDPSPNVIRRQLSIPDDIHMSAAVYGALLELVDVRNWEQAAGGTLTPAQAASLAENMLSDWFAMNCDCISNLSYNPSTRTLTYTDGNGQTQTVIQSGDLPNFDELHPGFNAPAGDESDGKSLVCGGVYGLIDYYIDLYTDALDEAQLVLDEAKVIADAVITFAEVLTGGVLELAPVDEIAGLITYGLQAPLDAARAAVNNLTNKETWREDLYCAILDNDRQLTPDVWNAWIDSSVKPADPSGLLLAQRFSTFMTDVVQWDKTAQRYRLYSHDEENDCELLGWCPEPDWCYLWDFSINDGSWYKPFNFGTYVAGSHWAGQHNASPGTTRLSIRKDFSSRSISKIVINFEAPLALIATTRSIALFSGETLLEFEELPMGGGTHEYTYNVADVTCDGVQVAIDSADSGTADIKLFDVRIEGAGTNPFGTDNCP